MGAFTVKKGQKKNLDNVQITADTMYICENGEVYYDFASDNRIKLNDTIGINNNLHTKDTSISFGSGTINRGGFSVNINPRSLRLFNNTDIMSTFEIPKIGICQPSDSRELFFIFEIKISDNEFDYFYNKYSNYMTELQQDYTGMARFVTNIYNGWNNNQITTNNDLLTPFYLTINDIPLSDGSTNGDEHFPFAQLDLSKIFYYQINQNNYVLYIRSNSIETKDTHTYVAKRTALKKYNNDCFTNNNGSYDLYYDAAESGYTYSIANSTSLIPLENKTIRLILSNSMVSGYNLGYDNRCHHHDCYCFGNNLINKQADSIVIGSYNNPILGYNGYKFSIGNGDSNNRKNIFAIDFKGNYYAAGSGFNNYADYAEYFEWKEIPSIKDTRGLFVTLDKDKIRLANKEDKYILGIISATPNTIGNSYEEEWQGKYQKDIFGCHLRDEDNKEILSQEYNKNKKYIPRSKRAEWAMVGLLGQIIVVDDGTCVEGGFCSAGENGIATSANNGYYVMERLDDNHIKVCFK